MVWLKKVLKAAGLDYYLLHSLRHTNITMQLAAGVPLITVAARAGHSKPSTTSDVYAHVIKSSDKSAAEIIDKVFNPPKAENPIMKEIKVNINHSEIVDIADKITVEDFKFVKSEMKRLGIELYSEYLEYLEYVNSIRQLREKKVIILEKRDVESLCRI